MSFRTAFTGAIMTSAGSMPLTAWPTIRAIGFLPKAAARCAEVTTTAAAPSFTPAPLPAVRRFGHGVNADGDNNFGIAWLTPLRCEAHTLQSRAADFVNCHRGNIGQASTT